MNETLKVIKERRSCRRFADTGLQRDVLSQIIEAGRIAPTGSNVQKVKFYVVSGKALEDLVEAARQAFAEMDENEEGLFPTIKYSIRKSKQGRFDFIYGAPILVVLTCEKGYANAMADCVCANMSMMLAAASLKVDSCYINQLHWLDGNRKIMKALGAGGEETICCSLALGYGDPTAIGKEKKITGSPVVELK
ncbi:MAG: nitroreductase family protein [Anaerovoracaceae bacterium]